MIAFKEQLQTIPSDLSLINLDKDPFYRYKMPQLKIKHQKKQTIFINLANVSKSLQIPPQYILNHFSLSIKTSYQIKTFKQRKEYVVKGYHEHSRLKSQLDSFIIKHLICSICRYPELRYRSQPQRLKVSCKCCGNQQVRSLSDKMKRFIHEHPMKKSESDLRQEEQERIYGNREIEYESNESEQSSTEQSL